jgi:hypothetical protein
VAEQAVDSVHCGEDLQERTGRSGLARDALRPLHELEYRRPHPGELLPQSLLLLWVRPLLPQEKVGTTRCCYCRREVGGGATVLVAAAPSRAAADGAAAAPEVAAAADTTEDKEEECDGTAMLVAEEEVTGRDDAAPAGPAAATAVAAAVDAEEGAEDVADDKAASHKPAAGRECARPTSAAAAGLRCGRCTDGWARRRTVGAAVLPTTRGCGKQLTGTPAP